MSNRNPSKRRPWSQPLADLVAPCLSPALAQFGFSEADLLMFWPEIVGERLASRCEPLRMQWPKRAPAEESAQAATLVVRVESAFAPELQHQGALVVERVNRHFGWRCVAKMVLRQGPVTKRPEKAPPVGPASEHTVAQAKAMTTTIADEDLRAALVRLGARVLSD